MSVSQPFRNASAKRTSASAMQHCTRGQAVVPAGELKSPWLRVQHCPAASRIHRVRLSPFGAWPTALSHGLTQDSPESFGLRGYN